MRRKTWSILIFTGLVTLACPAYADEGHIGILSMPRFDTKIGAKRNSGKLELRTPDNSLWFRYYQAGEDASLAHDAVKAKQYWMASLSELEANGAPTAADDDMSLKLSALEIGLTYGYPEDWSKTDAPQSEKLVMRAEQVSTLYRMAAINSRLVPNDTLLCAKSKERYEIARTAYEKAKSEKTGN